MVEFFKNLFKPTTVKQNVPVVKVKSVVDNSPPQLKSLFVSAGHSEVDAGASREYDGRLFTEADIVLEFRDMVCERLEKSGVIFERDGGVGENLPLIDAIKLAKAHDVSVEFHCNAFTDGRASGVETLSGDQHKALGERLCEAISFVLGAKNRGAKGEASGQHSRLGFISKGNGIIVELFFITSPKDFKSYQKSKERLADAVANVLIQEVRDA